LDRLFLDANVLFSAAYRADAGIARLWELPHVELYSSTYAVEEARRNLEVPERLTRLDTLIRQVTVVTAFRLPDEVAASTDLPEKDRPIVAGALAAGATHLITGDVRHFGSHYGRELEGVRVLPPARYLRGAGT